MKLYLLDTHTLGLFIRGIHPQLTQRMVQATQAQTIATSALCRAELRYGQSLLTPGDQRRSAIDLLLHELPTMAWTVAAADRYGDIQAQAHWLGQSLDDMNALVAAQAVAEDLTLVTPHARRLQWVQGLRVEDWVH
jgi:tRNA(fMet)-specific endonuclease VapC